MRCFHKNSEGETCFLSRRALSANVFNTEVAKACLTKTELSEEGCNSNEDKNLLKSCV